MNSPKSVTVSGTVKGKMSVKVRVDSHRGKIVAEFDMNSGENTVPITSGIIGKRAVYFEFIGDCEAELDWVTFDR